MQQENYHAAAFVHNGFFDAIPVRPGISPTPTQNEDFSYIFHQTYDLCKDFSTEI
jgi:hypothetical protein